VIKNQMNYHDNLFQGRVLVDILWVRWGGKPFVRYFRKNSVEICI